MSFPGPCAMAPHTCKYGVHDCNDEEGICDQCKVDQGWEWDEANQHYITPEEVYNRQIDDETYFDQPPPNNNPPGPIDPPKLLKDRKY